LNNQSTNSAKAHFVIDPFRSYKKTGIKVLIDLLFRCRKVGHMARLQGTAR